MSILPAFESRRWPFIGRERELEAIGAAFARGPGNGIVVTGGAGLGKTRLARAAADAAAGAHVEWVQATRSAAAIPLGAFVSNLPSDVGSSEPRALMNASAEALRKRAAGRPLLLVVDDVPRLDPTSATLLLHLVLTRTAFVLATARTGEAVPDAVRSLWKDLGAQRLWLEPLDAEATTRTAEAALGGPLATATARSLQRTSRGNALYLRELLRGAMGDGSLAEVDGLWRQVREPGPNASLTELVEDRLAGITPEERRTLELLALGEPLRLALLDLNSLVALERRGLATIGDDRLARVGHPLYADVLREGMPIVRAHAAWLELVRLVEGEPSSPTSALRMARWLVEAGEPVGTPLLLEAARAALGAGDAALAVRLASEADATPAATLLLAQALEQTGAHEEAETRLAGLEGRWASQEEALVYLRQRLPLLFWRLQRLDAATTLAERASGWWDDQTWRDRVEPVKMELTALRSGFVGMYAEANTMLADPQLDADRRARLDLVLAHAAFAEGRTREALEYARRITPTPPVIGDPEHGAWMARLIVELESGHDLAGLDAWAQRMFDTALEIHDHFAAGTAARTLGRLRLLEGRVIEAKRLLTEAELHHGFSNPIRTLTGVRAFRVAVALAEGDADEAQIWLARTLESIARDGPIEAQRPAVYRAQAWAALAAGDPPQAQRIALDAAQVLAGSPVLASQLLYDALLAGARPRDVAPQLAATAGRCDAPLAAAFSEHARALDGSDGKALAAVADALEALGARRYACEAAAHASGVFAAEGREDSARRLAARTRALHIEGPLPQLVEFSGPRVELTRREAQLVELASRGLTNQQIADRLVVSIRTVESHLYNAMFKLGVDDRRDL
jgi:DNA-binding CsgD family transcriptional regulator